DRTVTGVQTCALPISETELAAGGSYHFRTNGEYHLLNPLTISKLQHAVRQSSFKTFQEYTDLIDEQSRSMATLRSLLQVRKAEQIGRASCRERGEVAG